MGRVTLWMRLWLGLRIIFGRYEIPQETYLYHPKYSPSRVQLRHKSFDWDSEDE